jgi:hypothetical protein
VSFSTDLSIGCGFHLQAKFQAGRYSPSLVARPQDLFPPVRVRGIDHQNHGHENDAQQKYQKRQNFSD